jgi:hypothetical protein
MRAVTGQNIRAEGSLCLHLFVPPAFTAADQNEKILISPERYSCRDPAG